MKKLFFLSLMFSGIFCQAQIYQDTLIGLTAPTGALDDTVANIGIPVNLPPLSTVALRTVGGTDAITMTNGVISGDYACTATGWDNGMDTKYWEIGFQTNGASNLLLSSKQRAGGTNAGPKDWKVQYKIDTNGTCTDVPGATSIVCGNDWTTGVLTDVPLPAACNMIYQTLFLRWIMTTNDNISGSTVSAAGVSKLDEVFVKADIGVGMTTLFSSQELHVYPNPSSGKIHVSLSEKDNSVFVYDCLGNCVFSQTVNGFSEELDLRSLGKGMYLLTTVSSTTGQLHSEKVIIQ